MQTIRHLALQKELTRIEQIAVARSRAIINRSADLEAAYDLCLAVSVGLPDDDVFIPTVSYDDDAGGCQINVIPLERGAEFMRRVDAAGLAWCEVGDSDAVLREIVVDGYPRVHVLIGDFELLDYQRRIAAAIAA